MAFDVLADLMDDAGDATWAKYVWTKPGVRVTRPTVALDATWLSLVVAISVLDSGRQGHSILSDQADQGQ